MIKIKFILLLFLLELLLYVYYELFSNSEDCKWFRTILRESAKIFALFFLIVLFLMDVVPEFDIITKVAVKTIYFYIVFLLIIFNNYFGTRSNEFKLCIKTFLDETINFFKGNFSFNLIYFILLIFIKNYRDIKIALISSYVFFVLTTIHSSYKEIVKNNSKKIKILYIISQLLLNYFLLHVLGGVELIFNLENPDCEHFKFIGFLFLTIVVNLSLPVLKNCFEYFKKNINKKDTD